MRRLKKSRKQIRQTLLLLVRDEVVHVDVIFLARVRQYAIRWRTAPESPNDVKWFSKENRIVVRDGVLECVVVDLFETFGQMEFVAVFVSGRIEPAALVDSDRIHDESVAFPFRRRVSHELGPVIAEILRMFCVEIKQSPGRLILKQRANDFWSLEEVNGERREIGRAHV